jgi:hypothetical protein
MWRIFYESRPELEYFTKSQTISTCFHAGVMRADILVEIEDVAYIANPTTSD